MLDDSRRLRGRAREIVEEPSHELRLSVASIWEISIKAHSGRLGLPLRSAAQFQAQLQATNVRLVEIELAHAITAGALPREHGDPFDRMIVAQARSLGVPIVSADAKLAAYDVEVIAD